MAVLQGAIDGQLIPMDCRLLRVLLPCANCLIPEEIKNTFSEICFAVATQMEKEGICFDRVLPIDCLFVSGKEFSLCLEPHQMACCTKMAIYPIPALQNTENRLMQMMIMTEELCHLIWEISDEVLVNDKVLEVLQNIYPDLTLGDLGYRCDPPQYI